MNSLARRFFLLALLSACSGGPISDYPRSASDDGPKGDGDSGDGDSGDGDTSNSDDDDDEGESSADAGTGNEPNPDLDGGPDAEVDGGVVDDGGVDPEDGGDGGEEAGPGPIGTQSGDLGVLDAELSSGEPALFVNHFDLGQLVIPLTDLISYEVLARVIITITDGDDGFLY